MYVSIVISKLKVNSDFNIKFNFFINFFYCSSCHFFNFFFIPFSDMSSNLIMILKTEF